MELYLTVTPDSEAAAVIRRYLPEATFTADSQFTVSTVSPLYDTENTRPSFWLELDEWEGMSETDINVRRGIASRHYFNTQIGLINFVRQMLYMEGAKVWTLEGAPVTTDVFEACMAVAGCSLQSGMWLPSCAAIQQTTCTDGLAWVHAGNYVDVPHPVTCNKDGFGTIDPETSGAIAIETEGRVFLVSRNHTASH